MSTFEEKFYANLDTPLEIEKVRVSGLERTRQSVLEQHILGAFGPLGKRRTLGALTTQMSEAHARLLGLQVFNSVTFVPLPGSHPQRVTLAIDVEEKKRPFFVGTTYSYTGHNEGSISAGVRNLLGYAEFVEGHVEYGGPRDMSYGVRAGLPGWWTVDSLLTVGVQRDRVSHDATSAFHLGSKSLTISAQKWRHKFDLIFALRETTPTSAAPAGVRREHCTSLKNSLAYTYTIDKRNHPTNTTSGYAIRTKYELAGLGGDVRFYKNDVAWAMWLPVSKRNLSVFLGMDFGAAIPLFGSEVPIADKFHVGGSNMRGFSAAGVGPMQRGYSLGGNVYAVGVAALVFPVPIQALRSLGVMGHVFGTAGNLMELNTFDNFGSSVDKFCKTSRASFGVGLKVSGFEANVAYPLRSFAGDKPVFFEVRFSANM